ncbi:Uncharacterised protein [Mycobacterium tuberculosis]|uniref:Uncharacterized protein n=1 Tax=Mycobacterium tuberculosis TaxID=1773 RepID=A0A654TVK0_MYCTX|nr:Uncharacterised protein [Mycobacterium tuberculosis]CFS57334.1 Uncharacterised protein [Mycobacterium tuberculosis]
MGMVRIRHGLQVLSGAVAVLARLADPGRQRTLAHLLQLRARRHLLSK